MADLDGGETVETKWKTLSLTYVEYPEGDKLGMVFAIYSLTPLVIVIILATLFFSRRDIHTFTLGIGVILNHILNHFLKHYFAEARPIIRDVVFEGHGMPSNHSQYMWFVSTYLVLFLKYRLHHIGNCMETIWKVFCGLLILASAGLMAYSRVYLEYHTVSQVVWGSVIGAFSALVWFLITHYIFTPFYPTIVGWRISEFFLVRDCTSIPNIMWFEFLNTRAEAHSRKKKERKTK
ncbi:dolichyldiphosphatase 1 [Eurytemora carolleeae]|uniref:dolichyldiphosphatase 1 n=1 Tax=Eurytemora carolleeae TaxID=1294199 RepID=UPI000C75D8C1|nr:dolichyldiphosphatase 1 [Eurytemora carolleeae]XP_023349734.1 dolichyldiphosphatase 1 [Eurytemora carolleeae]XP_023349735.1 dolichyldiphosphatase 1 [Eurytemora carolleeae]|eukprot:XP_023349733.1 dolichyldiphosphatase 1-like [Eurytemora affinis]